MRDKCSGKEKREFIRLDSVFPVEYQLLKNNKAVDESWHHGFTNNVSSGGLCLELLKIDAQALKLLESPQDAGLNLKIYIPIHKPASHASAKILWLRKEPRHISQYSLGLQYDKIDKKELRRIMRVAYGKVILPKLALAGIIFLFAAFIISAYNNSRLSSYNKKLIEEMVNTLEDSKKSKAELEAIRKEGQALEGRLKQSNADIKTKEEELGQKLKSLEDLSAIGEGRAGIIKIQEAEIQKLKAMLSDLTQSRQDIIQKIGDLEKIEDTVEVKLREIKEKKAILEKENFEKMYQWVKTHQNPRSGLIASFEGDGELGDQAFTYDQALAVIALSYFKDYEPARKILDFYLGQAKKEQVFYNGYYVSTGEVSEFVIHSGPNLWLGIAVLQYTKLSADNKYLPLARDIAGWMLKLQKEDKESGLRGGPQTSWYSTEHNLDGFAFFDMFYKISSETDYKKAAENLLLWLRNHAYDSPAVPIKRGRGDATIATDTYAWSIASLGPERLARIGMDPEAIMNFAEDNCAVSVEYARPNAEIIQVKGFDFAKQAHSVRGGAVSCEWTAQMVLSYKILSRYFADKGDSIKEKLYSGKAEEYLEELTKMIIASPSRTGQGQGCLPYASSDFVDTGHGWMTPKGKNTGSLSATIYAIFAYYGFNPLELSD